MRAQPTMPRVPFSFDDIAKDCQVETECYRLDDDRERRLGARIEVPVELRHRYPYDGSAYGFLQHLRPQILELGLLVFPGLPVNRTNHTLAQRAPNEHAYSSNPYLTGRCQSPHQDTPPYPTAFWLGERRRYFATWVLSSTAAQHFYQFQQNQPGMDLEALHRRLVPESLANHSGLLLNQEPGLLLIDNSPRCALYHARTCNFDAVEAAKGELRDTAMYAFNEVGLLQYIDSLDERRGQADRCAEDLAEVKRFLAAERHGEWSL